MQQLADLPCPTVAAIHGFALGGGLELALACTYRVGADDAALSLGLPEVLLGIHPGFGGTVRSVQLIGVRAALELMLKGRPFGRRARCKVGLLDELVPPAELAARAKALLLRRPPKKTRAFARPLMNTGVLRPLIARQTLSTLRAQRAARALPCPLRHRGSVAALRRCGRRELRGRGALDQRVDVLANVAQFGARFSAAGSPQGTGRRFHGRVQACACHRRRRHGRRYCGLVGLSRHDVTLQDRSEELVQPAMDAPRLSSRSASRIPAAAAAALGAPQNGRQGRWRRGRRCRHRSDIRKRRGQAGRCTRSSNPDSRPLRCLPPTPPASRSRPLSQKLDDPTRLVGIHFFNPVAQMQLVEVVQGARTPSAGRERCAQVHPQARQAAAALQELAGIRGEPHPDALRQRGVVRARGRHPRRSSSTVPRCSSACRWDRSN